MNLHEFQAKQLLAAYKIPVPQGAPTRSISDALLVARGLSDDQGWVIKAQVHAGGRGKAGGVRRVTNLDEFEKVVSTLLGARLVTAQTTAEGLPVNCVLVEQPADIAREMYLAITIDRARERVVLISSGAGGIDIEEIAASEPSKIITTLVDPVAGLQTDQCRAIGIGFGLADQQITLLEKILQGLYRLFIEKDASLIEINPLILTAAGELLALDAKIQIDDNALDRHPELSALRDASQEDARETSARQFGLNYITLDGDIACMVNGAGLAMATMDLIKLHGGEPANFLDVGGGTSAEKVAQAFKLILSDPKVKAILVNIFGGIVRCDLIAEGIIRAAAEVGIKIPVVVRLEGTNVERGRALLRESGLQIINATDLTDAAQKAVAAAA